MKTEIKEIEQNEKEDLIEAAQKDDDDDDPLAPDIVSRKLDKVDQKKDINAAVQSVL